MSENRNECNLKLWSSSKLIPDTTIIFQLNNQLNSFIVFNMTHHCVKSASVASAAERTPTATKLDESHRHKKFSRDNSFS